MAEHTRSADIPETDLSASMALLHMAAGAYQGQAISVAAKLGIADLLDSGPKSPAACS